MCNDFIYLFACIPRAPGTGFVPVGCRICGPEVAVVKGCGGGGAFQRRRETVNLGVRAGLRYKGERYLYIVGGGVRAFRATVHPTELIRRCVFTIIVILCAR